MIKSRRLKSLQVAIVFSLSCAVILFVKLIPLDLLPGRIAPPDIMFCLAVALLIRRPGALPMWLVALVFLLNDILLSQPLGLWALIVLATSEVVRGTRSNVREMLFLSEWFWFAGLYVAATVALFVLKFLLFIPREPLTMILPMLVFTVACYPVVVLYLNYVFKVAKSIRADYTGIGARG